MSASFFGESSLCKAGLSVDWDSFGEAAFTSVGNSSGPSEMDVATSSTSFSSGIKMLAELSSFAFSFSFVVFSFVSAFLSSSPFTVSSSSISSEDPLSSSLSITSNFFALFVPFFAAFFFSTFFFSTFFFATFSPAVMPQRLISSTTSPRYCRPFFISVSSAFVSVSRYFSSSEHQLAIHHSHSFMKRTNGA